MAVKKSVKPTVEVVAVKKSTKPPVVAAAVKKSIKPPVEAVAVKKTVVKKSVLPVKAAASNTVKGKTAKQKTMTKPVPLNKTKPSVKAATPNSPVKK